MKKMALFGISLITLFSIACTDASQDLYSLDQIDQGEIIVTVNGQKIREGLLDTLAKQSPRLAAQLKNPLTRKKILESLIEQELLYQEAKKRGLDKTNEVQLKTSLTRHTIISNALLENELEKAMKEAYEKRKNEDFTKLEISQIGIHAIDPKELRQGKKPSESDMKAALEKAKKVKERLNQDEDFAKVAQEVSDDKRSAAKGGKAGQIARDDKRYARMGLKEIPEAAFKLKKGGVSDPIKTSYGYYIIKVTSDPIVTDFEDAKRVLGFELQAKIKQQLIEKLKKDAQIAFKQDEQEQKTKQTNQARDQKADEQTDSQHNEHDGHDH